MLDQEHTPRNSASEPSGSSNADDRFAIRDRQREHGRLAVVRRLELRALGVESRSHLAFWGGQVSYWEHCGERGTMSGSFSLLLALTVTLACDLCERTWARAGVGLVER